MLENVPLFSGLPKEALAEIEQHGSVKSYKKHVIVINQDDETYSLYVILKGSVKVFVSGEDGREAVLNHQQAGDYFGDLSLILGEKRTASVRALTYCEIFILNRSDFNRIKNEYSEFRDILTKTSAQKTDKISTLIMDGITL